MGKLLIHELSEKLDMTAKAIRYYEQAGIIPPPTRNKSNYRVYSEKDLKRLDFIKKARSVNFSLEDIKAIIGIKEEGKLPCNKVVGLLEEKITELDKQIEEMIKFRKQLAGTLDNFQKNFDQGKKGDICGFIENMIEK
jgi:MerR family Zn(II)-responsive transcriptional regulator of zntA